MALASIKAQEEAFDMHGILVSLQSLHLMGFGLPNWRAD